MVRLAPTALLLFSLLRRSCDLVSGFCCKNSSGRRPALLSPSSTKRRTATRAGLSAFSLHGRGEIDRRSDSEAWSRRSRRGALLFLGALALLTAQGAAAPAAGAAEVRGTAVTPFNSLAFQYRGGEFGGLRAEDVGEPSISYAEFSERLRRGDVAYVEFSAPFGDVARATIRRGGDGGGPADAAAATTTIRIGEGYPIEKHDGYSSPAFAIRAVQNAGVPYKFVVPGLDRYSSSGK
jgi:hypothetical protein